MLAEQIKNKELLEKTIREMKKENNWILTVWNTDNRRFLNDKN